MDKRTQTAKTSKRAELCELTTVCLIKDSNDNYLMQNRVKEDWLGYALPGGHIEPGENSIVESVIREMKEETGLTIQNPELKGIKQFVTGFGRYFVFIYLATEFTGQLKSSEEGQVEWIHKDKISQLNTVPNLAQVIEIATSSYGRAQEMYFTPPINPEDTWEIEIS